MRMKHLLLVACIAPMLALICTTAMASTTQWCVYLRSGYLSDSTMSCGNDGLLGVNDEGHDAPAYRWNEVAANMAIDDGEGIMKSSDWVPVDTTPPTFYTYNVTLAAGTRYAPDTVYVTAWAGTNYGLNSGYDLPQDYVVTVSKGSQVLASWTRDDMWLGATGPNLGAAGPVGFWYIYDSRVGSFAESTDILTVTVGPSAPEPGSLLALGSGLVGLAGFAIRRRKA